MLRRSPADRPNDGTVAFARVVLLTVVPAYILIILIGMIGFRVIHNEETARNESDRQILVSRVVSSCEERNITREALRGTIDAALSGDGLGDLTLLPSYRDLDPTTQRFVREIAEQTANGTSSAAALRAYRDTLAEDEDCVQVGADLSNQLDDEKGT